MEKDTCINIRIKSLYKDYVKFKAEKEGLTITEFILRKILPEKFENEEKFDNFIKQTLS